MSVFDTGNIGYLATLIRVLFVLAMISLLVIEGALLARRERRSAPNPGAPRKSIAGPAIVQGNPGYPVADRRRESNGARVSVPGVERHAA